MIQSTQALLAGHFPDQATDRTNSGGNGNCGNQVALIVINVQNINAYFIPV